MVNLQKISTDLLVIGGGAAGLCAAIEAQERIKRILILTKGPIFRCGSTFANINGRWGITWASNIRESIYLEKRINQLSCGTNEPELTQILVRESSSAYEQLCAWGVRFVSGEKGEKNRVCPCFCDVPLASVIDSCGQFAECIKAKLDYSRVSILSYVTVTDIITKSGKFHGIIAKYKDKEKFIINAKAAVLATGGNASCQPMHITEPGLTGDGYRLLESVGIKLSNMEFIQWVWEDVSFSASRFQAYRLTDPNFSFYSSDGEKIPLDNIDPELFMQRRSHVPISNLQPDKVIDELLLSKCKTGKAIRVINRHTGKVENHILPHAQACNGGVVIGPNGETPLPGLFAAGEVTTGMHGGDRVGGMMITNCIVFGRRAGKACREVI